MHRMQAVCSATTSVGQRPSASHATTNVQSCALVVKQIFNSGAAEQGVAYPLAQHPTVSSGCSSATSSRQRLRGCAWRSAS